MSAEQVDELVRNRLIDAVKSSPLSQREITARAELGNMTLSRYMTGSRTGMTNSTLAKLANVLDKPIGYFFGEDTDENQTDATADNIEYLKIPLFASKAAATPDVLEYCSDDIKREILVRADELDYKGTLHSFQVWGDSMSPDLHDGDYVIVQRNGVITPDIIERKAIYLCQIEDLTGEGLTLKRVQIVEKGLLLISINPDFPVRFIDMKNRTLESVIKGRVVRSWRQY